MLPQDRLSYLINVAVPIRKGKVMQSFHNQYHVVKFKDNNEVEIIDNVVVFQTPELNTQIGVDFAKKFGGDALRFDRENWCTQQNCEHTHAFDVKTGRLEKIPTHWQVEAWEKANYDYSKSKTSFIMLSIGEKATEERICGGRLEDLKIFLECIDKFRQDLKITVGMCMLGIYPKKSTSVVDAMWAIRHGENELNIYSKDNKWLLRICTVKTLNGYPEPKSIKERGEKFPKFW